MSRNCPFLKDDSAFFSQRPTLVH